VHGRRQIRFNFTSDPVQIGEVDHLGNLIEFLKMRTCEERVSRTVTESYAYSKASTFEENEIRYQNEPKGLTTLVPKRVVDKQFKKLKKNPSVVYQSVVPSEDRQMFFCSTFFRRVLEKRRLQKIQDMKREDYIHSEQDDLAFEPILSAKHSHVYSFPRSVVEEKRGEDEEEEIIEVPVYTTPMEIQEYSHQYELSMEKLSVDKTEVQSGLLAELEQFHPPRHEDDDGIIFARNPTDVGKAGVKDNLKLAFFLPYSEWYSLSTNPNAKNYYAFQFCLFSPCLAIIPKLFFSREEDELLKPITVPPESATAVLMISKFIGTHFYYYTLTREIDKDTNFEEWLKVFYFQFKDLCSSKDSLTSTMLRRDYYLTQEVILRLLSEQLNLIYFHMGVCTINCISKKKILKLLTKTTRFDEALRRDASPLYANGLEF
jgi:hypothetical protein